MRALILGLVGTAAVAAVGVAAAVSSGSPPPLAYESVSGYPMRVYYRNLGQGPERLSAVGGLPALSKDEPLSASEIDTHMATVRKTLKTSPTLVRAGDFVWFPVDDPDGLAWEPEKMPDRTTYFYVFAEIEMPRSSLLGGKWVSELCLVSKTHEAFQRCPTHNDTYASN